MEYKPCIFDYVKAFAAGVIRSTYVRRYSIHHLHHHFILYILLPINVVQSTDRNCVTEASY
jgi:hypothetical protein